MEQIWPGLPAFKPDAAINSLGTRLYPWSTWACINYPNKCPPCYVALYEHAPKITFTIALCVLVSSPDVPHWIFDWAVSRRTYACMYMYIWGRDLLCPWAYIAFVSPCVGGLKAPAELSHWYSCYSCSTVASSATDTVAVWWLAQPVIHLQ